MIKVIAFVFLHTLYKILNILQLSWVELLKATKTKFIRGGFRKLNIIE